MRERKQGGMTLLEVMLVLAVFGVLTLLVVQQYVSAKRDADVRQLQSTVTTIFIGLSKFYYANCRQAVDPYTNTSTTYPVATNSLDPANNPPVPFIAMTDSIHLLTTSGATFINTQEWPPAANGLVDTAVGDHGFFAQYNLGDNSSLAGATVNRIPSGMFYNWETGTTATSFTMPNPVGTIYTWRPQVAVKLVDSIATDPAALKAYQAYLGAQCTSKIVSGSVAPCKANTPGPYLVWEKMPSMVSSDVITNDWLTMPRIKAFNQMYVNDDMYMQSLAVSSWNSSTTGNTYSCGE